MYHKHFDKSAFRLSPILGRPNPPIRHTSAHYAAQSGGGGAGAGGATALNVRRLRASKHNTMRARKYGHL